MFISFLRAEVSISCFGFVFENSGRARVSLGYSTAPRRLSSQGMFL